MSKVIRLKSVTTVQDFQKISSWSRKKIYLYLDTYGSLDFRQIRPSCSGDPFAPSRTQLIPFQLAKNILLEEQKCSENLNGIRIEYQEGDVYVDPSLFVRVPHRPIILTFTGHTHSNGLSISDTLSKSQSILKGSKYSIEATSVSIPATHLQRIKEMSWSSLSSSTDISNFCTIIEAPSHASCSDARLHAIRVSDRTVIAISLEHGVDNLIREAIKIVKELRREFIILIINEGVIPIVNKIELQAIIDELWNLDINVEFEIDASISTLHGRLKLNVVPLINISPKTSTSIDDTLGKILVYSYHKIFSRIGANARNNYDADSMCRLQAVIVDSYRDVDTGEFMCLIIVRSGIIKPGMWFLADYNFGQVIELYDTRGRKVTHLKPGFSGMLSGLKMVGCPSVGTHIIAMDRADTAKRAAAFRTQLSWYIQHFTKMTHLLRPKGMATHFHHVGNFGQISDDKSLEYRLCYGDAVSKECSNGKMLAQRTTAPILVNKSDSNIKHAKEGFSVKSIIRGDEFVPDGPTELRCVILSKSVPFIRTIVRFITSCSTKGVKVTPVATFVGSMRDSVVRTAVQRRATIVLCFQTRAEDAMACWLAEEKSINIMVFESMDTLVSHIREEVKNLSQTRDEENILLEKSTFASTFIPDFYFFHAFLCILSRKLIYALTIFEIIFTWTETLV